MTRYADARALLVVFNDRSMIPAKRKASLPNADDAFQAGKGGRSRPSFGKRDAWQPKRSVR